MGEKWYEDLPEDFFKNETDKAYEEALKKIREGLDGELGFDGACAEIDVQDEDLRKQIIDDILKILIAKEHFTKKISLDDMAKRLKVAKERLASAKSSMLKEVQNKPIS